MKVLTIKIQVDDHLDAYKTVNHLNLIYGEVLEATVDGKKYTFSKTDKTKLHRHFLKEDFGKQSVIKKDD